MKIFKRLSRSVKGRVAIVTGAGSGMGEATAKVFASEGVKVVVSDVNFDEVQRVSNEIEESGRESMPFMLDVTDSDSINKCIEATIEKYKSIDFVINNAGVSSVTAVDDKNYENYWDDTLNVVLTGQVRLIRAALPHLLNSDNGRIVNISSVSGKDGNAKASAYSSSKAGVIALTKSLGKELANKNIAVNAVTPAGAKTRILNQMSKEHVKRMLSKVPRARFLKLNELSSMVCWLSSEENSFSTAAVFDISGGRSTY